MATRTSKPASGGGDQPELKRRRLLDAGGPVEDDETARQKMRDAKVGEDGEIITGFDPDNVEEMKIAIGTNGPMSPMTHFAREGDLPMMRWLYVNGADTRNEGTAFWFPMYGAVVKGHLDACSWLYEHGATDQIKRRIRVSRPGLKTSNDFSPLKTSFWRSGQRELSRWLVLRGALCKDDDSGDLDIILMEKDLTHIFPRCHEERLMLLQWARGEHQSRTSFRTFMLGTVSRRNCATLTSPLPPCASLDGKAGILELIGAYADINVGREARIIRQLTEILPSLILKLDG